MTRFRRTKAEIEAGLSPEAAATLRLGLKQAKTGKLNDGPISLKKNKKGEIVVRIRPTKGVDADYFDHLSDQEIIVEQDNDFYKWLDHYLSKVYDSAGGTKLFQNILNNGISSLIGKVNFEKDIN